MVILMFKKNDYDEILFDEDFIKFELAKMYIRDYNENTIYGGRKGIDGYNYSLKDNIGRKLYRYDDNSNYNHIGKGYIFWSLEGSPPKGFAVYQNLHKRLLLCDAFFEKKKIIKNAIFVGEIKEYYKEV